MSLNNKPVALITGASSGFGMRTAERLHTQGWIVYAAARRVERMATLSQRGIRTLAMDVSSEKSIKEGVKTILQEEGRIDALLNNAGFGSYGGVEDVPIETIHYQFDVNLFGAARVIRAVLPTMRKQNSGRIVNTASVVAHISTAGIGWYAATKHALSAMTDALRQELSGTGIYVSQIEPGVVRTGFEEVAITTLKAVHHQKEYQDVMDGVADGTRRMYKNAPGPESTVKAMVHALTAKKPKSVYKTTWDSRWLPLVRRLIGGKLYDKISLRTMRKSA